MVITGRAVKTAVLRRDWPVAVNAGKTSEPTVTVPVQSVWPVTDVIVTDNRKGTAGRVPNGVRVVRELPANKT